MKLRYHIALMVLLVSFMFGMVAGLFGGVDKVFAAETLRTEKVGALPASVKFDASCKGEILAQAKRGVFLMAKYGQLPGRYTVRVECKRLGADGADGLFVGVDNGTDVLTLNSSKGPGIVSGTTVHELVHFLDFNRYGNYGPKKVTATNEAKVQAVREAFTETVRWAEWSKARTSAPDRWMRDYCAYLLDPAEIFARAMTQFVAQASRDAGLAYAVDTMSDNPRPPKGDGKAAFAQWEAKDFVPVYDALARLVG